MTHKSPIPASAAVARWRRPGCLLLLTLAALLALWLDGQVGKFMAMHAVCRPVSAACRPWLPPMPLTPFSRPISWPCSRRSRRWMTTSRDWRGRCDRSCSSRPGQAGCPGWGQRRRRGPCSTWELTHTSAAGRLAFDSLMPVLKRLAGQTSARQPDRAHHSGAGRGRAPVRTGCSPAGRRRPRSEINTTGFSTWPQGLLDRFDAALPLRQTLVRGAMLAPALLGADGAAQLSPGGA